MLTPEIQIAIFELCSLASFGSPPRYTAPSEEDLEPYNVALPRVSREALAAEPTHSMHSRAAPVLLTHVCRAWRSRALGTPKLWKRFKVVMTSSARWDITPRVRVGFPVAAMEAQIARCGKFRDGAGGNIDVVLELPGVLRQQAEDLIGAAGVFGGLMNLLMVPEVVQRWKSLSVISTTRLL